MYDFPELNLFKNLFFIHTCKKKRVYQNDTPLQGYYLIGG